MRHRAVAAATLLCLASLAARGGDPTPANPLVWSVDVVVADESGRPVAGARVEAFALPRAERRRDGWDDDDAFDPAVAPRDPVAKATTDAKGAAHVEGLAFGLNAVVVAKTGFAARRRTVPAPGTDVPLRFELLAGHPLEGRVLTDDGRPVAGAHVVAAYDGASPTSMGRYGVAETPSPLDPHTMTDADGRWRFDALPEGEVAIAAAPVGTWTSRLDRVVLPNVTRYDYVLEPRAPVAGTVRDKETGAPLRGAVVEVEGYGGNGHRARARVVADGHGQWSLPLFVPGAVEIRVKGYKPAAIKHVSGADDLDVRLERAPAEEAESPPPPAAAWIRGIVFGPDGGPLSVEIRRQGGADWAASSEDGAFVLPCDSLAAPVRVWAVREKGDFVMADATPAATADEAVPVVLRWPSKKEPTFHVAGVVRPPEGVKLVRPRVAVNLFEDGRRERWTSTSPDGRFDVEFRESERGYFQIAATADGCGVAVAEKPASGVELRLSVGASIRGKARVDGAPLGRASVRLGYGDPTPTSGHTEPQFGPVVATTADDGTFAASGLPAGSVGVSVEASGLVGTQTTVDVSDGATTVVDAELVRPLVLRGVATWPDGSPVVGADVSAKRVGGTWSFGEYEQDTTDREGRFALRGLRPGRYNVDVSPDWDDRSFLETRTPAVAAGGPPTTVVVRVGAKLRGHVVDQRGAPVAGADLRIDPREKNAPGYRDREAKSAADGSFEMRALDDGEYLLAAHAFGLRTAQNVGVRADMKDLRVVLPDGVTVEGVLVDATGAPLADRIVRARRIDFAWPNGAEGPLEAESRTDAAGRFVLAGLDEGRMYLDVNGERTSPRYVVAPTRDARLVALAELALSGNVWEGSDEHSWKRRLPGARVRIDVAGRAEPIRTVTDDDGEYQVGGLPKDAKLTIHAELEGFEEVFVPTVEGTRDGETVVMRRKSAK